MVFWIVLGLLIASILFAVIYHTVKYDIDEGIQSGIMVLGFGSIIGVTLLGLMFLFFGETGNEIKNNNGEPIVYKLKSIGGWETYDGKYYLIRQDYNDEKHYLYMYAYPEEEKGYDTLDFAYIRVDEAVIHELKENEEPYAKYAASTQVQNDWLFPWLITSSEKYEKVNFFIPEGSVVEDSSLLETTNKGTENW